ncbi:MAG: hypothetical protein ACO1OQ_09750, partial [Rufibacter sp.]
MRLLQRDGAFAIVFTLLYALFLGWFMQFHELWFDETMPWLLALYSKTYPELLQNKIYEGHPNLWYSLLYVITRFTQNLQALKASQFVFAVGFVFVFLRYAPFHWAIRLLFCFGYYGLFEYGVISRLYAMELLTLFSVCALYPKRFSHWYLYLLVLCLCAHTHLFGLMFCGVMGLLLFSEAFGFWKNVPHRLDIPLRKRWIGLLLWALNCLLSVWSMARPGEFLNGNVTFRASTRIWQAFFPIPQFNVQFWNSSLFHEAYEVAFSILIFGLLVYSLRKTWPILLTLLALYGG